MPDPLDRLKAALADRYRVDRELGCGGMATVHLAEDLKHHRPVALKILKSELAAILGPERFLREIELSARLTHPHILPLHDSGNADGFLYYVMPYVEGESLRDRLTREKQLPLDDALRIAREVADALSYAHSHGVIHRDIKPENILLESGHAVVADFGIARAIDAACGDRLTETGVTLGTPTYMSPEQAGGSRDLDGRSDLYSLGCVLFEMLAGQAPFTGPTIESVVRQHLAAEPPSITNIRPSVPSWVVAALERSLAKTPADRFNPVAQFGEAIAPRVSVAEARAPRPAPPSRRGWVMLSAAVAVVLLVTGWFGRGLLVREAPVIPRIAVRPYTIVASFDGTADDEVRKAATNLLSTALDQSGVLAVLPDDQLRQAYRLASKPDTLRLDVMLARELAVRGAIRTVVAGTVDRVGRSYHLAVRVLDADSGTVIATERGVAEDEDGVITALDGLARSLRKTVGEEPDRIVATRAAGEIMTPSFEAYRWFRRGGERDRSGNRTAAREAYGRALEIDRDFAQAWAGLGFVFARLGYLDSSLWALDQALARPQRQTAPERLYSLGAQAYFRNDPTAALPYFRRQVEEFGGTPNGLGVTLAQLGRFADAAALMEQWERAAPFGLSSIDIGNYADWLMMLGRYDEAHESADRRPQRLGLMNHAHISSQAGDYLAADSFATRALDLATDNPQFRRSLQGVLAGTLAVRGRIGEAMQRLRENVAEYRPGNRDYDWPLVVLALAVPARLPLDPRDLAAVGTDSSTQGMTVKAVWQAAVGDTAASRQLLRAVRMLPPEARPGLDSALTLAEAWIGAWGGRWQGVSAALGGLAVQGVFIRPRINALTRWLAAEADERLGVLDSAAAMYERIAAWSGFGIQEAAIRGLVEPFAHQRLVVLYARTGRLDDARRHWKIFSETFTQPDPEVAHLVDEARAALEGAEAKGPQAVRRKDRRTETGTGPRESALGVCRCFNRSVCTSAVRWGARPMAQSQNEPTFG